MKGFAKTEKQLRNQISEVEKKDKSLVNKIEDAVCFGKVTINALPMLIKPERELLNTIKRFSIELPLDRLINQNANNSSGNNDKGKKT